jgi:hypothetical protein
MRVALLLLVGACWSSSTPAPTITSNASSAPMSPAPTISWTDSHIVDRLLPAIATDGSVVVLGIEKPDGARGNPNFRLELRGRDDRVQWSNEVLTASEVDSGAFFDETGPLTPLRDRIARANAALADLHAKHHLVPLKKMALENNDDAPPSEQTAHGGNLVVVWKADHVIVSDERGDGKAVLLDRAAPTAWLAAPSRSNTQTCSNPAYLDETWAAPEQHLVVITVNYEGTDTCWEPDAQLHLVTW